MSPELARQALPLIAAIAEGKTLQYRLNETHKYTDVCTTDHCQLIINHPERFKVKQNVMPYRRYINNEQVDGPVMCVISQRRFVNYESIVRDIETSEKFIRWIDQDWVTTEVV